MPLLAVIFDLDGVLCDTSRLHALAWQTLLREMGLSPPPDLEERIRGIPRLQSLRLLLGVAAEKYSLDELHRLAERKNAVYLRGVEQLTPASLYAGVRPLLEELRWRGVRIGLGSASRNAPLVLERLGIAECFEAVADGESYRHGKPHPDIFWTAARMLQVAPADALVVEDAPAGIQAALAGGFTAVGVGPAARLAGPKLWVEHVSLLNWEILRGTLDHREKTNL